MNIQLVSPTERYRESFLRGLREFRHEGLPWWVGGDVETAEQDFAAFVAKKFADSNGRNEPFVPKTHLWAVTEEQFVGRISIHHELNDALRVEGGHIGYDTVPSNAVNKVSSVFGVTLGFSIVSVVFLLQLRGASPGNAN